MVVTYRLQDDLVCGPTGRDCIEGAIGQDFNCSVSCEGIYADVQWLGGSDGEKGKGATGDDVDLQDVEGQRGFLYRLSSYEENLDRKKIFALVNEYNAFKKRNVRHFKFNAETPEPSYGKKLKGKGQLFFYNVLLQG